MPSQAGMSLVEIMVALAIGLFLVLIATTIYMQGLSSFGFRVGQSENLGNSRARGAARSGPPSAVRRGYRRIRSHNWLWPETAAGHSPHALFLSADGSVKLDP